jgi:aerobic-type carbon monoxide dehydrogenase small subunit (CoxS/CutS family)
MRRIDGKTLITLFINGRSYETAVYPFQTLLDVLRDNLGFTGCKPGCENGDCGACTVIMDGWPMKSCLCLAVEAPGHDVVTVEGLQRTTLQEAFSDLFAMQCGYCTPGFMMNAHALLNHHPKPDDDILDAWMQSNICRCTCYEEISQSIRTIINNSI